ncbi:MAG TPA: Spy/CpxP family protein refolding chaperone [Edaphobacter sp.]
MTRTSIFAVTFASLFLGAIALAQQPDTAPAPPTPPSFPDRVTRDPRNMVYQRVITTDGMHSQLRIGPSGIWWKNPDIIQKLTITPDQQKRMDDIFQQSRIQLIDLKAAVEKQEVLLEPMLAANPPDTSKVLAQIDKAAQARAELEKANAKMLLGIRTVLTPDQWTKLQAEERGNRRMIFRERRPEGPGTPGVRVGPEGPIGPVGPVGPMSPQSLLTLPPLPTLDEAPDTDEPFDLNF